MLRWFFINIYCSVVILLCFLFTWETWEGFSEIEFDVNTFVWKSVEFIFIRFKLEDEINEVFWLLELLEVLSIDNVAKLILDLDDQFNQVQAVQTVILKSWFETELCLLGCAEIASADAKHVLFNLISILKSKSGLLSLGLVLPQWDFTSLKLLWGSKIGWIVQTKLVNEVSLWGAVESIGLSKDNWGNHSSWSWCWFQ